MTNLGPATHHAPEPDMADLCVRGDADLFRSILSRIGDKWSLMIIGVLNGGPKRFTELKAVVPGISARMLTLTLRQLERDGLVTRTVFAEIPPRVEYRCTPLGTTLQAPVIALAEWIAAHQDEIATRRDAFDAREDAATLAGS